MYFRGAFIDNNILPGGYDFSNRREFDLIMKGLLSNEIVQFVKDYGASRQLNTKWDKPLIGFAEAGDSLFPKLKEVVSPTHAMPQDLLADAQTVIVYFLPFEKKIPKTNRHNLYASKEWALAYIETNQLIIEINHHISKTLSKKGFNTFLLPPTHNFDASTLISDWSHKHIAYIAGLGKFGTHHLIITDKGCCGRLGSVVTNAQIDATKRTKNEYCLSKFKDICKVCVKKCVNEALKVDTFDRQKCYQILLENAELFKKEGLADVCGKCTCIVPCSYQNPVEKLLKS